MPASDVREYLHDGQFGTGMLWKPEDPKNYLMSRMADVQRQLLVGYPDRDETLTQHMQYTYNQGASPSCVWHAISGQQTGNEHIERKGETLIFDAMGMHLATGPANEGRYTGDMLKIAQDQGTKLANSSKKYKIGSYAFAPKDSPQNWEATIKAAIASGHICGLALLLPSNFGWESSGSIVPNSYHEVMIVGYRPDAFLIKNSWGSGWGQNGFGWVPISFLTQSAYQNSYVFANTILDAIDDDLAPNPPDPPHPPTPVSKRYVVTALARGSGLDTLKQGVDLTASGGGFTGNLGISAVQVYDDVTPPAPGTLAVTGYDPATVKPGANFTIIGQGFGSGGNVFVSWRGQPLSVLSHSDTALFVTAPTTEGTAPVVVRVEAAEATGPNLTISSGTTPPDPPNPGGLAVVLHIYRSGASVFCDVTVSGPDTALADLTWEGAHGMLPVRCMVNGSLVRGRISGASSGQSVTVTAQQGANRGQDTEAVP